jgi:NAD(P)-dependent dehydrogenase (short-subunit alcohol dehydrogenase family)
MWEPMSASWEEMRAIASKGRRCVAIRADLRRVEGPRIPGAQALEFFGTVDILVNNAGVFHRQSIIETTIEQWDETQAVNLRAPFLLAQVVVPGMIKQRIGKVINVSSLASVVRGEGHAGYSASKGGMNMSTRVMAAEWGMFNIQMNAIVPAVVPHRHGEDSLGRQGEKRARESANSAALIRDADRDRRSGPLPGLARLGLHLWPSRSH